jgi:VanZ family protein
MSSPAGTVWDRVAALTRSPWFRWGALIAWGGVIWIFGASQVLPMNHGDIGRFLLRKSLHVLVYAILGALLVRARGPGIRWRWVILVGVLVGLADELHQATVPHRSFRIDDIAIDIRKGLQRR